jgi:hypothetical protein
MNYSAVVISNRWNLALETAKCFSCPVTILNGAGYDGFAQLVNHAIVVCPSEIVIIASDRARPRREDVEKTISLINEGYGFVGLYCFGFFGFKKELIRQVGWLDERYVGGGCEDSDFLRRVLESDIAYYESRETPFHTMPSSWKGTGNKFHAIKWTGNGGMTRNLPEAGYDYPVGPSVPASFKPASQSRLEPESRWVLNNRPEIKKNQVTVNNEYLCSCIVIGTTLQSRLPALKATLQSIEEADAKVNLLSEKIISIDDFGNGLPKDFTDYLDANHWRLISKPRRGMAASQLEAIEATNAAWILYCEDDVIVQKLPTRNDFMRLQTRKVNGRPCGYISLMAGGYATDGDKAPAIVEEIRKPESYIELDDGSVAWVRNENLRNAWFVEFPVALMKRDAMLSCARNAAAKLKGEQIEMAFTIGWFDLGWDKKYYKTSYMRNPGLTIGATISTIKNQFSTELIYVRHQLVGTIMGGHNVGGI